MIAIQTAAVLGTQRLADPPLHDITACRFALQEALITNPHTLGRLLALLSSVLGLAELLNRDLEPRGVRSARVRWCILVVIALRERFTGCPFFHIGAVLLNGSTVTVTGSTSATASSLTETDRDMRASSFHHCASTVQSSSGTVVEYITIDGAATRRVFAGIQGKRIIPVSKG